MNCPICQSKLKNVLEQFCDCDNFYLKLNSDFSKRKEEFYWDSSLVMILYDHDKTNYFYNWKDYRLWGNNKQTFNFVIKYNSFTDLKEKIKTYTILK